MTGGITMGQKDWRFCHKCRVMFFDGDPANKGSCAKTGPHVSLGINFDLPHDVAETPLTQGGWRFCGKCFAMFFDGDPANKGSCPFDGEGHASVGTFEARRGRRHLRPAARLAPAHRGPRVLRF